MIHCAECDDWFHFECVHLNEDDADDISESYMLSDGRVPLTHHWLVLRRVYLSPVS